MKSKKKEKLISCSEKLKPFLEGLYKKKEEFHSLLEEDEDLHNYTIYFDRVVFPIWWDKKIKKIYIRPRLHFANNKKTNEKDFLEDKTYFSLDADINRSIYDDNYIGLFLGSVMDNLENRYGNLFVYSVDDNVAAIEEPYFLNTKQTEKCIDVFLENFDFEREFAKKLENI